MARKPIEIPIGMDAGAFEKGVSSGIIEPLGDAKDALRDLAEGQGPEQLEDQMRAAQKQTAKLKDETRDTADAIERNFKSSYRQMKTSAKDASDEASRGMRDAQKQTAELEDETRDTADTIERSFKIAYRKVKESSDDATHKMKDGFTEAKEEAGSSGREAAASFGGGFDDVADFVQETLANALSGFGPVGAAAGIALAAVLGTALAQASEAQEKLQDAREAAADLASEMYENGGELPLQSHVDKLFETLSRETKANGGLQSMIDQWVDFGSVLDDIDASAKIMGRTTARAIDALTGQDIDSTKEMLAAVNDELDRMSDWTPVWDEQYQSLTGYRTELEQVIKTHEVAERVQENVGSTAAAAAIKQEEAAERAATAAEKQQERVTAAAEAMRDSQAGAYDSMRDKAYEKATADDAAFDVDKWLSYVEETRAQADAYRNNLQTMQLSPDEWSNLLALPEEARASIAASYASTGEEGKTRIRQALGDGGGAEAGAQATVSFSDAFKPEADVVVNTDTSESTRKVDELTKPREMTVKVRLDTSEVDSWTPPPKFLTTVVNADTRQLERSIDRYDGRTITVNVEGRNRTGVPFQ